MFTSRVRSFGWKAVRFVVAMLTCSIGAASALGQVATTTTVSLAPNPVYDGEIPVATVTVTASNGSTPDGSATCSIQTRGHEAAYRSALQNGVATMSLTTLAQVPVGEYRLGCTYPGDVSATYAASVAPTLNFEIVNFSAWIVNSDGTVSLLNYSGVVLATLSTSHASAGAGGIAIDSAGNAWAVTSTANSLVFVSRVLIPYTGFSPGAITTSTFNGGGLLQPSAVAIDGAEQVWIANGGNSVSAFSNNGTAQSPPTGYGATTTAASTPYNAPNGIAVDQAGSVWITNSGGNSITRIFGSAAPVVAPLVTGTINGTTGTRP